MRIMIVDDDARMRQALTRLLQNAGFQSVEQASDGQEALDRVVSAVTHVDLIITDCAMPRLDGLAFVRALRTRGDHTPVIMISGEHNPDLVIQAIKAGVNNYVPKPIHVQSLIEKIWQTLSPAEKDILVRAAKLGGESMTKAGDDLEKQGLEAMKQHGITISEPDIEAFKEALKDVYKPYEGKLWPAGLVDKIRAMQK